MDGLDKLVAMLQAERIQGEFWVNGSFLTEKMNPRDSDVVLCLSDTFFSSATPTQKTLVQWFHNADLKPGYLCDSYVHVDYPVGHPLYATGDVMRSYWKRQYSFSRRVEFKGVAVLTLP
jgi:hypothetical protein